MNWQEQDTIQQRFILGSHQLADEEIHVWQASMSQYQDDISYFWLLLNKEEQERAERFVYVKHRHNFIIARALLRLLLATYLQCDPISLVFQQNEYGKLSLAKSSNILSLQFNLSHAEDVVMYAITLHRQIGIDVEHMRDDVSLSEIAQRFFATEEQQAFFSLPVNQQVKAFFNCWTRKEAFIKAIGKGLSYSLSKFVVDLSLQQEIAKVNLTINDDKLMSAYWSLFNLPILSQYCAAVVVEGKCEPAQIRLMQYDQIFSIR